MKNIILTSEQKEILFGMILGDAHVRQAKPTHNPCVMFHHGVSQLFFIKHLRDVFDSVTKASIATNDNFHKALQKRSLTYSFATRSLPCFLDFRRMFSSKKVLPLGFEELLTPRALAYWIMCDSGRDRNALVIHTNNFSQVEVDTIVKVLYNKFGIEATKQIVRPFKYGGKPDHIHSCCLLGLYKSLVYA